MSLYVQRLPKDVRDDVIEQLILVGSEAFLDDPLTLPLCGGDMNIDRLDWNHNIQAGLIDGFMDVAGFGDPQDSSTIAAFTIWYGPGQSMFNSPTSKQDSGYDAAMQKHSPENREWWDKVWLPKLEELKERTIPLDGRGEAYSLSFLAVHPSFQRRGLARALLNRVLHLADGEKREVRVKTCTGPNIQMYERFGFVLKAQVDVPSQWGNSVMSQLVRPKVS